MTQSMRPVLRYLRRVTAAGGGDPADEQLLERFVAAGEAAAFEELLRRHGPMVFGVCRRILRHAQDAEDAFQATFLVLVRRSRSLGRGIPLGPWLHGVACRTALHARGARTRRQARERQAEVTAMTEAIPDADWRELRPVLDEEVQRLPEKYRAPFVLCYLEGKTYDEAAAQLGCPKGTVATRLTWARQRLQTRLLGRGLALSAAALAAGLAAEASAAMPGALVASTLHVAGLAAAGEAAVAGATSARVAALAEGVVKTMTLSKFTLAVVLLCAAGLVAAGGVLTYRALAAGAPAPRKTGPEMPGADLPQPKGDRALFEGEWKVVEAEANGKHQPNETSDRQRWVISADTIAVHYDDGSSEAMTYRLAPDRKPREIDLTVTSGHFEGYTWHGIYELAGDRLLVCYTRDQVPGARPTTFDRGSPEFAEDSGRRRYLLERVRKGEGGKRDNPESRKEQGPFLKKYQVKGVDLEAGFVPYKTEIVEGEPIAATFTVKNVSDKPFSFEVGGDYRATGRHDRFKISATDANGRALVDPRADRLLGPGGGIGGERPVKPGETTTDPVDLTQYRTFIGPGDYTITCAFDLGARVETTYRLTILPRTRARVERVRRELAQRARQEVQEALKQTVDVLVAFAGEEAVTDLAELAREGDAQHRAAALAGLGRLSTPEAVGVTLRGLRDPDEGVRRAAAAALGSLKTDAAVEGMIARLPQEGPAGTAALLVALGQTQSPKALPYLVRALGHADPSVRRAAVRGLAAHGGAPAVKALERCAIGTDLDLREAAVTALVESLQQPLRPEWILPVIRAGKDYTSSGGQNPSEGLRLLRLHGGEHRAALMVSCLDFDNPSPRSYLHCVVFYEPDVIRTLPDVKWFHDPNSDGTPEQVEENRRILRQLRAWLATYEKEHHDLAPLIAPPGFSRPGPEVAAKVAKLIRQLGSDRFEEREAAGQELEAIGTAALEALRQASADDEDPEVRHRAAAVFVRIRWH